MSALFFLLAAAAYLAGTAGYLVFLIRSNETAARLAWGVMLVGLGLHTVQLILGFLALGHIPAVSLSQSFSFFAWAVVAGYLAINLKTNVKVLGSFAAPAALLLMILAYTGPDAAPQPISAFKSIWLTVHVITAFLGDGILAVAALAGAMYLLLEREIKSKRQGWLYARLPSLGTVDNLQQTALVLGFLLLTVGMLTGAVYAQMTSGTYWRWDPKETWSLIAWLVYAALLHQRLTVGWRGRKAAWVCLIAFAALLFTFLGASLIQEGYHNFSTYGLSQ